MRSEVILAAVAVTGLLVTAASVVGTFRVSRNTSTVSAYRDSAQAWESKAKAQEDEIHDLQGKLAAAAAQIESLNQRVAMLQDIVTSRTQIEALSSTIDGNFLLLVKRSDDILAVVADIRKAVIAGG